MAIQGMDEESVRRLSKTMSRASDELNRIVRAVDGSLRASNWIGPDSEAFRSTWATDSQRTVNSIAAMLADRAQNLDRQLQEQGAASRGAGSSPSPLDSLLSRSSIQAADSGSHSRMVADGEENLIDELWKMRETTEGRRALAALAVDEAATSFKRLKEAAETMRRAVDASGGLATADVGKLSNAIGRAAGSILAIPSPVTAAATLATVAFDKYASNELQKQVAIDVERGLVSTTQQINHLIELSSNMERDREIIANGIASEPDADKAFDMDVALIDYILDKRSRDVSQGALFGSLVSDYMYAGSNGDSERPGHHDIVVDVDPSGVSGLHIYHPLGAGIAAELNRMGPEDKESFVRSIVTKEYKGAVRYFDEVGGERGTPDAIDYVGRRAVNYRSFEAEAAADRMKKGEVELSTKFAAEGARHM